MRPSIRDIREARQVLKARPLTQRQRHLLRDIREGGIDYKVSRLRETLGTATFDAITLDAAHNGLIAGYGSVPSDYRRLAAIKPANDFRDHNESALSGIPDLPIVVENQEYQETSQLDEKVTYKIQKRGTLLRISMEAQVSDALNAFAEQNEKLGKAAKNTANEFVLGTLFDNNPTVDYDSTSLFHSNHNNLSTTSPLSHSSLETAIAGILNQTGRNSEQIYIRPRFLAVNPSKLITAMELVAKSKLVVSGATDVLQTDTNAVAEFLAPEVFASPHLDAAPADAYVIGDVPPIVLRFLNGREEPEILRAPEETGMDFTHDSITWKVRHVYGGDVVEHRGVYKLDAA